MRSFVDSLVKSCITNYLSSFVDKNTGAFVVQKNGEILEVDLYEVFNIDIDISNFERIVLRIANNLYNVFGLNLGKDNIEFRKEMKDSDFKVCFDYKNDINLEVNGHMGGSKMIKVGEYKNGIVQTSKSKIDSVYITLKIRESLCNIFGFLKQAEEKRR